MLWSPRATPRSPRTLGPRLCNKGNPHTAAGEQLSRPTTRERPVEIKEPAQPKEKKRLRKVTCLQDLTWSDHFLFYTSFHFCLYPQSRVSLLSSKACSVFLFFRSSAFVSAARSSPSRPLPFTLFRSLLKHHLHRQVFLQHSTENTILSLFILFYSLQKYFLFCDIVFML